ncbi:MAG: hypothetical protein GY719_40190 [bacterium]|nr:hypothetical protein [bacterium]
MSRKIRQRLKKWASKRLEFFDAAKIEPGAKWRETIRTELSQANIFFLVLTNPAMNDFDWPLYEAGLFESLAEEDRRRIVCIYDADSMKGPPDQLRDLQGVPATKAKILELLLKVFHDKEFSLTKESLNEELTEDDLRGIATEIAADVSGVASDREIHRAHGNPYIRLQIPAGVRSLGPEIKVESDQVSLKSLFEVSDTTSTWGEVVKEIPLKKDPDGFNLRWVEQLEAAVSAIRSKESKRAPKQLTCKYLARDGRLYRPEIEIYRTFANKRLTVDVSFSEQIQDSWLQDAKKEVALAAYLALASRIRHELIEPYGNKVRRWRPEESEEEFDELSKLVKTIEHDGHFIGKLIQDQLEHVFEGDEADTFFNLGLEYATTIKPMVHEAMREMDPEKMRKALRDWEKNNLRFLDVGLHRYQKLLGVQRTADAVGPRPAWSDTVPSIRPDADLADGSLTLDHTSASPVSEATATDSIRPNA